MYVFPTDLLLPACFPNNLHFCPPAGDWFSVFNRPTFISFKTSRKDSMPRRLTAATGIGGLAILRNWLRSSWEPKQLKLIAPSFPTKEVTGCCGWQPTLGSLESPARLPLKTQLFNTHTQTQAHTHTHTNYEEKQVSPFTSVPIWWCSTLFNITQQTQELLNYLLAFAAMAPGVALKCPEGVHCRSFIVVTRLASCFAGTLSLFVTTICQGTLWRSK